MASLNNMCRNVLFVVLLALPVALSAQRRVSAPKLTTSIMKHLGLGDAKATKVGSDVWQTADGVTIYSTYKYGKDFVGYMGPTPLFVAVKKGVIMAIAAAPNAESLDYFVMTRPLLTAWNGKTLKQAKTFKPDVVSGATYSSKAIIHNVNATAAAVDK